MNRFRLAKTGIMVIVLLSAPPVIFSMDAEHAAKDEHAAEAPENESHGEFEHGREPKNEVALFLGGTDEHGHDTEFTWALDYKRRVGERWAVGGYFDFAGGELRDTVLGALVV